MAKHKEHRFVGQTEGNALAGWLNQEAWNDARREKVRRRVVQLMTDLGRLDEAGHQDDIAMKAMFEKKWAKGRSSASRKAVIRKDELRVSRDYRKIARRVDRTLSLCSMLPRLTTHDSGRMEFGWRYSNLLSEGLHLLITVAQIGFLERMRRCANGECELWFFAKFPKDKYCSRACQIHDYQTSEAYKAKRLARDQRNRIARQRLDEGRINREVRKWVGRGAGKPEVNRV